VRKAAAAVLLVGAALAGCTQTEAGQPVDTGGPTTGGGVPSAKPPAIPARPKELALNGLDPCKLVTKAQSDQVKVTAQRNTVQTEDTFKGAQVCAMDGRDGQANFHYNLWLITTEGIEPWLSGTRNSDAKLVDVGGFAAATVKVKGTTTFNCETAVDVARGQQMMMEFRPDTRNVYSQEQMCQKSQQAAGLALQTLLTLK
jgi:hypothetical protein